MQIALILGLPVLVILLIVLKLKLNQLFSYVLIAGFGIVSTYTVEFVFCSILKTQCEPDPLNLIGFILHSFYVIVISWVIYTILPGRFKKHRGEHFS